MRTTIHLIILTIVLTTVSGVGVTQARSRGADAHRELATALTAMGGRGVLTSVHTLRLEAVGHRNVLEQSLRPEGPWGQDYFQLDEIRDFDSDSERIAQQHRGVFSMEWWLQDPNWVGERGYPTYVVSGGAVAQIVNGKYSGIPFTSAQDTEEDFAFGPLRVLFTALAASDLHSLFDVQLHSYNHHVLGFTWHGYPVRLYLNGYTCLPEAVEWSAPRPYDQFWSVWGDVRTRITFDLWTLEPDGLRYPRQWTIERNGLPDSDVTVTSLTINPPLEPGKVAIPAQARQQILRDEHTIAELPLGIPGQSAIEIEPGILHIDGYYNTTLIRQRDGIVVLEGPISSDYSIKVLAEANRRFPGLPVKAVITTSDAWPHIGGMREYVARGIPIYALDLDRPILTRLFEAPHTFIPDDLQRHPHRPRWHLVTTRTALGGGANRLELIPYRTETGERQVLVYLPAYRLLYTSDLFSPLPYEKEAWFTPEYLLELRSAVAREHLDVDAIFGMHYDVTPFKTPMSALDKFLTVRRRSD